MSIVLIGFKNCGKTSVGKLLAEKTNKIFIDTDHLIEKRYHIEKNTLLTTHEIYQNKGEQCFRDFEKTIITALNSDYNNIIATGGGSVLDSHNVTHLKKLGKLIYLYAPLETLLIRLQSQLIPAFLDQKHPERNFQAIYKQRKAFYKNVADIEVSTENKSITDIADEIIFLMRSP